MVPRAGLLAGIIVCVACASPPQPPQLPPAPPGYSFELDGVPLHPRILSMEGDPTAPRPGDLVEVDGRLLVLDDPGPHRWRKSPDALTPLVRVREDGSVMAAFLECGDAGPGSGTPLDGVRGIRVNAWTVAVAAVVGPLHPERFCLEIRGDAPSIAPDMPTDLRHLAVHTERSFEDLANLLGRVPRLRSLVIGMEALGERFDVSWIEGLGELRVLRLERMGLEHLDRLGRLTELRDLALLRCDEPAKPFRESALPVGFLEELPRLRRLDLSDSAVRDLEPAGAHAALEYIRADGGVIEKLPSRPLPALRVLTIPEGKPLPAAAIDSFRAAHPGCRVISDWMELLRDSTADADRIRFRTGGTCHVDPVTAKTLSDERGPEAVRVFLDGVALVRQPNGGRCMCCGGPTVEIYAGATLVAEIGMQHSHSLRWSAGWPGDAAMTLEGAEAVCRWMAARGDDEPLREFEKAAAQTRSGRRRWAIVNALLPEDFRNRLKTVDTVGAALPIFEERFPDEVERATLALRIFGAGEGSWIHPYGLEFMAEDALRKIPGDPLRKAMTRAVDDASVADGAARWIFHEWKPETQPTVIGSGILQAAAERALAHPRSFNRRRTMEVLGGWTGEPATGFLRRVLGGSIPNRNLPADLVEEPFRGFVPPTEGEVYAAFSDRAYAALLLARRGDRESLPAILALEKDAPEEDREALRTARELLEAK